MNKPIKIHRATPYPGQQTRINKVVSEMRNQVAEARDKRGKEYKGPRRYRR